MTRIPITLAESYVWRNGVDEIRGCLFCIHGDSHDLAALRRCHSPDVTGTSPAVESARSVDCHVARSNSGACGVEARFLKLRGE